MHQLSINEIIFLLQKKKSLHYALYKLYNNKKSTLLFDCFFVYYQDRVIEVPNTIQDLHMEIITHNEDVYML